MFELGLTSFAEAPPEPVGGKVITHGERLRNVVAEIEKRFTISHIVLEKKDAIVFCTANQASGMSASSVPPDHLQRQSGI